MRFLQKVVLPLSVALLCGGAALAQNKPVDDKTVVNVQIVLSRYEGDKRTSSLPYTMLATADRSRVSLRTGAQVPILTAPASTGDGKQNPVPSFQYLDIGTNVDCTVAPADNGRFKVEINVQDRSVLERSPSTLRGAPQLPNAATMRNFTYSNSVILRDGETRQFVAASDKVSGDTIRMDVTLKVEN